MVNVIAVIQTKGGTGKTTTTMLVASALTALGDRVLVLDSDKQGSATDWAKEAGDILDFEVSATPTGRVLETAVRRASSQDYDFILIDTPPGSNNIVEVASSVADLVLVPTGVSAIDLKRTQATLDFFEGTDIPVAVVLVNVDKREKLLDLAQQTLSSHTRAALADVIIPTRSATRRAAFTAPRIMTKAFAEWMDLARELKSAF